MVKKVYFNRAFTLIELLVVVAIISILTALILPNFSTAKARSRDGKRVSDISQLKLGLELFAENCAGQYPASLTATCPSNSAITVASYLSGSQLPKDPSNGGNYYYVPLTVTGGTVGVCNGYHLGALTELGATSLSGDTGPAYATVPGYGVCSLAVTGTLDFKGNSGFCNTSGSNNMCYDVTN
jgi:prepilin-type N-terminal cleavage/methylation domain-containing protein